MPKDGLCEVRSDSAKRQRAHFTDWMPFKEEEEEEEEGEGLQSQAESRLSLGRKKIFRVKGVPSLEITAHMI